MKTENPTIGVVGGMGPQAGHDLLEKILTNTRAERDQDHFDTILVSRPGIPDRTDFIIGKQPENPAPAVVDAIALLDDLGVGVIGIPCNSLHAAPIFDEVIALCAERGVTTPVLHLIEEVAGYIKTAAPDYERILVLCTSGSVRADIFSGPLAERRLQALYPDEAVQAEIHWLIYAIKSGESFAERLAVLVDELKTRYGPQCDGIVLGCTELSIIADHFDELGLPVFDSNDILARALIVAADSGRLTEA